MDKPKKAANSWNIAATHGLIAGFIIPFMINAAGGFLMGFLLPESILANVLIMVTLAFILIIISIYFGVIYSAKYLNKKYIIKNKTKVINLSTIFTAIITFIIHGVGYYLNNSPLTSQGMAISFISLLTTIILFYVLSYKYVNQTYQITQLKT